MNPDPLKPTHYRCFWLCDFSLIVPFMNRNPIYFAFGSFAQIVHKVRFSFTSAMIIRCFRLMDFRDIKRTF
jgi:hypothetical protein